MNVSKRDKKFANSDDYFTSQSNFENKDNAFDETSDDNEKFQYISQIAFRRRIALSSSFNDKITKNSRDKASRFDYAKLHNFRKRTQNSTLNSDNDSENSENIIESINYS